MIFYVQTINYSKNNTIMEKKFFYLSLILAAMMMMGCNNSNTPKQPEEVATPIPEKQTITGTIERMGLVLDVHFYVLKEYPGVEFRAVHKYTPEVKYLKEGDIVTITYHQSIEDYQITDELDIHNFDI